MNPSQLSHHLPSGQMLELVQGDITVEHVDAIVNAANAKLQHGGGVAAVIARKGGPAIGRESRAWIQAHGPVPHARPAWTTGGDLAARYVIHAVGPVWGSGDEDAKLADAVAGSLALADELTIGSISFPAISTGIFGFPRRRAAGVILRALQGYFSAHTDSRVAHVRLVLYDAPSLQDFSEVFEETFNA